MFDRKHIWRSGSSVAVFTIIVYLGLALRDVLLARWFGVGNELDVFYIAMLWPMFIVTVFAQPFGETVTVLFNRFKATKTADLNIFIFKAIAYISVLLGIILIILAVLLDDVIFLFGLNFTPDKHAKVVEMVFYLFPLIFFSGTVIAITALLNAIGKHAVASISPVVVPVFALIAIIFFSDQHGILSIAVGMTLGQMLNFMIVMYALYKQGYGPTMGWEQCLSEGKTISRLYFPYVLVAICVANLMPVDQLMASALDSGSVSAFTLGAKIVFFVSTLTGTVLTMVLLPYFSHHEYTDNGNYARQELKHWVNMATIIMLVVTTTSLALSQHIVMFLYHGREFTAANVEEVTKILDISLLQLPFTVINLVILKYMISRKKVATVILAFGVASILNIYLNLQFMGVLGPGGIALATSIATATITLLILLVGQYRKELPGMDMKLIVPIWVVFIVTAVLYIQHKHHIV